MPDTTMPRCAGSRPKLRPRESLPPTTIASPTADIDAVSSSGAAAARTVEEAEQQRKAAEAVREQARRDVEAAEQAASDAERQRKDAERAREQARRDVEAAERAAVAAEQRRGEATPAPAAPVVTTTPVAPAKQAG